ncbi:MAG: hydroxymethylbilane synthase [Acidimicrobiia bacterium]|nr:hydroxymethylbilane synthase [Acidimicrobiia bacterium]MYC45541.1 hydroxymethylbilane synthase [Acidimicrobiia bacterium]
MGASNWPVPSASSSTSEYLSSGAPGRDAPRRLRIATRSSPLALWQAAAVGRMLSQKHPGLGTEAVPIRTEGDRLATASLADIGGKGVFVRALQAAVLDGRAEVAVHSAKDLPSQTPEGLCLAAVPRRGEVRDALVGSRLADLGEGAVVATGSARRRVQLADQRPDLRFADLRGNIDTRLAKAADFDAVVIALVALERLDRRPPVLEVLDLDLMVPQVGQGALAVECRAEDRDLRRLLAAIEDAGSRRCVDAERAFLAALGGDCTVPAGAHARLLEDAVQLSGVLAPAVGEPLRRATVRGDEGVQAGRELAEILLGGAPARSSGRGAAAGRGGDA